MNQFMHGCVCAHFGCQQQYLNGDFTDLLQITSLAAITNIDIIYQIKENHISNRSSLSVTLNNSCLDWFQGKPAGNQGF